MDFDPLPPEINSARMYSGPRAGSMLDAADAWDRLADELYSTAISYRAIITTLTDDDLAGFRGRFDGCRRPYVRWLTNTAAQAEEVASQARAAASAFETAFAATVPAPMIEANRAQLASLIADNAIGQNTPAITAVEADYAEMWARNASARYRDAGASAAATTLTPLAPPTLGDNPVGPAATDEGADNAANAQDALFQAMSAVPQLLRRLAQPMHSASATSAKARLPRLSPFSVPRSWGDAAFGSLRSIA
jgi:PPE-repeat protein